MTHAGMIDVIGYLAAGCTTLSFIPQIIKIRRQGGQSLSYLMLSIYLGGLTLWLVYGIMLQAGAMIVANALSVVLVSIAIVMKATTAKRSSVTPRERIHFQAGGKPVRLRTKGEMFRLKLTVKPLR